MFRCLWSKPFSSYTLKRQGEQIHYIHWLPEISAPAVIISERLLHLFFHLAHFYEFKPHHNYSHLALWPYFICASIPWAHWVQLYAVKKANEAHMIEAVAVCHTDEPGISIYTSSFQYIHFQSIGSGLHHYPTIFLPSYKRIIANI